MHLGKEQTTVLAVDNGDVATAAGDPEHGTRDHSTRDHSTREHSARGQREGRPVVRTADEQAPAATR